MRDTKTYLTPGDYERLKRYQTPTRITITCCCDYPVTETQTDENGVRLPYCRLCGIFYKPTWRFENGELHISTEAIVHRDTPPVPDEIPQDTTQTPTQLPTQPQKHKDVRGKILALFQEKKTLRTAEIQAELRKQIDTSRQSIDAALKKLIAENKIIRLNRGVYQRMDTRAN